MKGSNDPVLIEQHLQDFPTFLVFPVDEVVAFVFPVMVGMLGKKLLLGILLGAVLALIWKRFKGSGGIPKLAARAYYYLPQVISGFKRFPDSAVVRWRA